MPKKAVSVSLEESNLLWLKGRAAAQGRGNLSDAIDRLIAEARAGRLGSPPSPRSIAGTIDVAEDDPNLDRADAAVRDLFERSVARPIAVKESRTTYAAGRRPAKRRG